MKPSAIFSVDPQVTVGIGKPQTVYERCVSFVKLPMHNCGGPAMEKKTLNVMQ